MWSRRMRLPRLTSHGDFHAINLPLVSRAIHLSCSVRSVSNAFAENVYTRF